MQQLYELDLGPGMGVATLREINDTEHNNDMKNLFGDLEEIRNIMLEFNIITAQQGEQLCSVQDNVSSAKVDTVVGCQDNCNVDIYKKRQGFMRTIAIVGGGGIGAVGFLVNPLVGVGAIFVGGSIGWFITRGKTVDKILTVFPNRESPTENCLSG